MGRKSIEPEQSEILAPVREPISKRLRFEVFKRDGFKCCYCGASPPDAVLECDHIEPVSNGGATDLENLITACHPCNRGKSNVLLSDIPQSMADRAAEVIERESQIAAHQAVMKQWRMRLDSDAQEVLESFCERCNIESIPQRDFRSIKLFIENLGLDTCLWATDLALQRKRYSYRGAFLYFCGICWKKIREKDDGEGA